MAPFDIVRLARIAPHVLPTLLRLFRLRRSALARVADGVLHRCCVRTAAARIGGAAAVDFGGGLVGGARGGLVAGVCGGGGEAGLDWN